MNEEKDSFNGLNFSGDSSSWFDLWHTHSDWQGEAQNNLEKRIASIKKLITLYEQFRQKLKTYPRPFQLWIEIWEDDSSEDAVYIHTANPNNDNFPIRLEPEETPNFKDSALKDFIEKLPFTVAGRKGFEENVFYLYKTGVGMELESFSLPIT